MLRLVGYFIPVAIMAWGLSWLADRPGTVLINWQGREIEISVFHAVVILALVVGLAILAWSILVQLWRSPAALGALFNRRRHLRGLDALSSGMIAIGAGDRSLATRYAVQARKSLPNEPLTHLLRAQAAQLAGDRSTARRIFEAMLGSPDTEQLGLRGLFLDAEREGEYEAARQFAERAVRLNPKLGWPVDALFDLQCKEHDWDGALETLAVARRNQQIDKSVADRRRAVLLTARAQSIEDSNPDRAMQLALEAHHLSHDLIPAAAIAGRILAARGHTKRAAHVIERTWRRAPHPDLAAVYAHARVGDSPRDRLERVKRLANLNQHSIETPLAIAAAAIEARDWDVARRQLETLTESRMTQRVCTMMARIESEQSGDAGRVREWLARAVHAARDAAWTADETVSDHWAPVSPVTGRLDAFEWRTPVAALARGDTTALARKLDELVRLGSGEATPTQSPKGSAPTPPSQASPSAEPGTSNADRRSPSPLRDKVDTAVIIVPDAAVARPAVAPSPATVERVGAPPSPSGADAAVMDGTAPKSPIPAVEPVIAKRASVSIEPKSAEARSIAPTGSSKTDRLGTGESTGTVNGASSAANLPAGPRTVIPPRAPDDPGLEPADDKPMPERDDRAPKTSPAKRSF